MKLFQKPILLLCLWLIAGCREEYFPEVKSSEQSLLVVEGVLNNGGTTTIRLTRTFKLDDSAQLRPENGAFVSIESQFGTTMPLYDLFGNGHYTIDQTPLNPTDQYRVRIVTQDGKEYASDYVPVLKNPPIDSVSWKRNESGVTIFVNTHNPENDTRYYRWEFEETWMIRSSWYALYKMVDGFATERRLPEEQVYFCWRTNKPAEVLLGSTAQLDQDVVFEKKLLSIPPAAERLGERYSVLVRQFALDKKGYEFYQLLKKNTESLGSIFDAQPTELSGNVHALSGKGENVIGYVTAAPMRETRIFIEKEDVPGWGYMRNCGKTITVSPDPDSVRIYFSYGDYLPYGAKKIGFVVLEYYGALRDCVDCTTRGGSTEKPSFW